MADDKPLPALDSEPEGEFVDVEDFFGDLTAEEIEEGNHLGATIDTDDDEDTGARETYR